MSRKALSLQDTLNELSAAPVHSSSNPLFHKVAQLLRDYEGSPVTYDEVRNFIPEYSKIPTRIKTAEEAPSVSALKDTALALRKLANDSETLKAEKIANLRKAIKGITLLQDTIEGNA